MNPLIDNVLNRLNGVRKTAGGWEACCPAHEDARPSLSISVGDDGRVLLHCHAGCAFDDICRGMDLSSVDLFPKSDAKHPRRIGATYDHRDENGAVSFQAIRFEPKNFAQCRPDGRRNWIWNLSGVPQEADAGRLPCLHVGRKQLFNVAEARRALAERAAVNTKGRADA